MNSSSNNFDLRAVVGELKDFVTSRVSEGPLWSRMAESRILIDFGYDGCWHAVPLSLLQRSV